MLHLLLDSAPKFSQSPFDFLFAGCKIFATFAVEVIIERQMESFGTNSSEILCFYCLCQSITAMSSINGNIILKQQIQTWQ